MMPKTAVYLALFGVLVSGAGLALADEMPPDMKAVAASKPQPNAGHDPGSHARLHGMTGGVRETRDRRMQGHRMGMHAMQHSGMAPEAGKPMQTGRGC